MDRYTRPWEIWIPDSPAIVLGNSQSAEREINVAAAVRDGIPIHKRMSGGGAVLLSPGCVCMALRFRKDKTLSIQDYFSLGSAVILAAAKEELRLDLCLRGTSDLACATPDGERKVAGSALYMPRHFVLYLVSILVSPDLSQVEAYLAHPSKEPEYRAGRSHSAFLSGLAGLSSRDVNPGQMAGWLTARIALAGELDWELAGDKPQG